MPSLNDTIDRLSYVATSIRTTSEQTGTTKPGPFYTALFNPVIQEVIRDLDDSELGLFTLDHANGVVAQDPDPTLSRKRFTAATPLRKRPDVTRELDGEVYAEAALKYIDRYQSVKSMPQMRAHLLHVLNRMSELHESIREYHDTLQKTQKLQASSPRTRARYEEKRVQELQERILVLKKRKALLLARSGSHPDESATSESIVESSPLLPKSSKPKPANLPEHVPSRNHAPRVSHGLDQLLANEKGPSVTDSPITKSSWSNFAKGTAQDDEDEFWGSTEDPSMAKPSNLGPAKFIARSKSPSPPPSLPDAPEDVEVGDVTVTPTRVRLSPSPPPPPLQRQTTPPLPPVPEPPIAVAEGVEEPSLPPVESEVVAEPPPPSVSKKLKEFKVTMEMEEIVSKIWTTLGETLFPTHQGKPLRAKETLSLLLNLQTLPPPPPSPSSVSSLATASPIKAAAATSSQIVTSYMLLNLLSLPPQYSLPLTKLKEAVSARIIDEGHEGKAGYTAEDVRRSLYNCVGKKLLKFERGKGAQIVEFDLSSPPASP
ncbi:hypothetical protein SISNIDRAFT_547707 [Sistotremastrum niveocremeum HHB9708]|uniref:Uncharacterized protein n=1 Tax=Sistotremastrum niveocremeum HHB9708 TaxID=1314777 RepID=A0A164XRW4_9AGAM|nr:hypothetical protein SISNIDRAFT_547707 [Sistotremastrum niveocremeum HHB9708]